MHSLMNRLDVRCEGTRRIQCNRRAWGSAVRVVGCLPCAGPRKPVRCTRGFCFDLRRVAVGMQGSGLDPGSSRRCESGVSGKGGAGGGVGGRLGGMWRQGPEVCIPGSPARPLLTLPPLTCDVVVRISSQ